ncbi:MAG: DUF3857 and transglutaminase domain-containing protein [Cyclobacteriaceae bacterium]
MRFLIGVFLLVHTISNGQTLSVDHIPDSLKSNAKAVVRYDSLTFEVIDQGTAIRSRKYAITLMNGKAKSLTKDYIFYDKFSKVNSIEARVYDKRGKLIEKIKNRDIVDVSGYDGFSLYSDNRYKIIDFGPHDYPFTIEVAYTKEVDGLLFYPTWYPVFDEDILLEKSVFRIISPANLKPRYKSLNVSEPVINVNDRLGLVEHVWTLEEFPTINQEPYGPWFSEVVPIVYSAPARFEIDGYSGSMETWKDLGLWQKELNKGRSVISDELMGKMNQLTAGLDNDIDKIRAIYEYVQNNTRYVSIQLGIGGWQTFPALTVEQNGYGDCKALTNFTHSILKSQGIESIYTLIRAGRGASNIHTDFPSSQFNHVILAVPQPTDTLWLECTSQTNPFGYLGKFTGDRDALMITDEGGVVTHTPVYDKSVNVLSRTANVIVDKNGNAKATVSTTNKGLMYEADNLDYYLNQSSEDQKDWLYKIIEIPSFEIDDFSMTNERSIIPSAEVKLDLTLSKYASVSGKRLFIVPNLMNRVTSAPRKIEQRKSEVVLINDYTEIDSVIYQLPQGMHPEYIPEPVNIESEFGTYSSEVINQEGQLIYVRKLVRNKGRFPAESYEGLRSFYLEISKHDNTKSVMVSST